MVQKILGPKKIFFSKKCWVKKRFSAIFFQKDFVPKKSWGEIYFVPKKILGPKNCRSQIFLDIPLARVGGVGVRGAVRILRNNLHGSNEVYLPLRPIFSLHYTSPGGWVSGWLAGKNLIL